MAEEKQTPEIEQVKDTMSMDDVDMLREVLEDAHSRGIVPVSVYSDPEFASDDF